MTNALFVVVGAFVAIVGLAAALNLAGAADRLARYNASKRDSPERHRAEDAGDIYPESRTGMRIWGVIAMFMGLYGVWAGLTW